MLSLPPVELHFDAYFDLKKHLQSEFISWQLPLRPQDFHEAIIELRERSQASFESESAEVHELLQNERDSVSELLQLCDLTVEEFRALTHTKGKLVIVVWKSSFDGTSWHLAKTLKTRAQELGSDCEVFVIDIDQAHDVAKAIGVKNIPMIQFFSKGSENNRFIGSQPFERIVQGAREALCSSVSAAYCY